MGWANCGTDSRGRPIGYAHEALCDYEGCNKKIDRGLGYACGDMHGASYCPEDGLYCEGYYCGDHLYEHNCEALIEDDLSSQEHQDDLLPKT